MQNYKAVECLACHREAIIKDYRERNLIIDGYPVCKKHFGMDDLNFWKSVTRKTKEVTKNV